MVGDAEGEKTTMGPMRRKMTAEVLEGLVGVCSLWGCFLFFSVVFPLFFLLRIPGATGQPNAPITQKKHMPEKGGLLGTWLGIAVWWAEWRWTDEAVGRRENEVR